MTNNHRILISGAGIAGLTLAYWMRKFGFEPVLLEKRHDLAHKGYMIDFYGPGFDVAEEMGLLPALREKHYPISDLDFVDSRGRTRAALSVESFRRMLDYRHFNFMRGDLENVILDSIKDEVPIQYDTSIERAEASAEGIHVDLSDGTSRECDLLFGADGIHSNVRALLWGPEGQFEKFLGYYVACGVIDNFLGQSDAFYSHVEPKTNASLYSIRGGQLATFFAFKSPRLESSTRQDQFDALLGAFRGQGWVIPEMLQGTVGASDAYFDRVSQIRLTQWFHGRVALLGDACHCMTLLAGQGASIAMAGAYILAHELHAAEGDFQTAFAAYQERLGPEIERRQQEAIGLAGSLVPDSKLSIFVLYLFLKVAFLPGFRSIFKRSIGAASVLH